MTTSNEFTNGYTGTMPAIGARVVTADGEELGTVKEVASSCFKVDVAMQPDFWLTTDTIASGASTEVQLSIAKDRIGDFKVDPPADSGVQL
jgi:hypothetical protein